MKKILSVLLLAAMLVGCIMPSLVSAADVATLDLSVKGPSAIPTTDKTVELDIELSGNSDAGIWGATFAVAYTKGWTVSSVENGDLWTAAEFDYNVDGVEADAYANFTAPNAIDPDAYDVILVNVQKDEIDELVTNDGKVAKVVLAAPADVAAGTKLEVKLAYDEQDPMTVDAEGDPVDVAFNVADYSANIVTVPVATADSADVNTSDGYVVVNVTLADFPEVKAMAIYDVEYDAAVLKLVKSATVGGNEVTTGWAIDGFVTEWDESQPGYGAYAAEENTAVDPNGVVFTFVFEIVAAGETTVDFAFTAHTKGDDPEADVEFITTNAGTVKVSSVKRGDVDGNGVVNTDDALYLLEQIMLKAPLDSYNQDVDFDENGVVNTDDALDLLEKIMMKVYQ